MTISLTDPFPVQQTITAFAILLLAGCGRDSDSRPANEGSDISVAGTSNSLAKSDAQMVKGLSDGGEIRVVACEYILRHELMRLTNGTVFISLTNNEMQALAARLPGCRFRSIDKLISSEDGFRDSETGDTGFVLRISEIESGRNEAEVLLAARFVGSATMYSCHLKKRSEWTIERIEPGEAVDFRSRPRSRK